MATRSENTHSVESVGPGPARRRRAAVVHVLSNYALTFFVVVKGVVLVPLYLRAFGMESYGAWLASGNVLTLLGVIESGLTVIYSQRLSTAYGEQAWAKFARVAGSGALPLVGAGVLVALFSVASAPWVPVWVRASSGVRGDLTLAFATAGIGAGLTLLQTVAFSVFYAWQRPLVVGAIRVSAQVVEVTIILYGLLRGWGLVALGVGQAAGGVVGLGLACWVLVQRWRGYGIPSPTVSRTVLRDVLRATTPFFASRLGSALLNNNEPLIASIAAGPAAAAIYGLTDRVFKVAQMIVNPVAGSVFYGVAHLRAEDATGVRLRKAIAEVFEVSSVVAGVALGVAAAMNGDFVRLWVGSEKFAGASLNVSICLASVVVVRSNLVGMLLAAIGETSRSAWSTLVEVALRAPLMWLLMTRWGMVGLPFAMLGSNLLVGVAYCTSALLRALPAERLDKISLAFVGVAAEFAILGVVAIVRYTVGPSASWPQFFGVTAGITAVACITAFTASELIRTMAMGAARRPVPVPGSE